MGGRGGGTPTLSSYSFALFVLSKSNIPKFQKKKKNRWTQFRVLLKRGVLAQLRNPTDATSRLLLATWVGMLAGLTFFNLGPGAESVQKRLGLLFFTLLLFELLPFCYMSFYVEDRRFFAADVASDLYHPSAYYVATVRRSFFFFISFQSVALGSQEVAFFFFF